MAFADRIKSDRQAELAKLGSQAPFPLEKHRKASIARANKALEGFKAGVTRGKRDWRAEENDVIVWTLPVAFNGQSEHRELSKDFEGAVKDYVAWLASKDADKAIEDTFSGDQPTTRTSTGKRGGKSGPSAAWAAKSPEEKAAIIAKRTAARKANKAT